MREHLEPVAAAQDPCPAHAGTSQRALCLDHRVQRGRLDGLGQELPDASQAQQLDAQSDLVEGRSKHLGCHVSLKSGKRTKAHFSEHRL